MRKPEESLDDFTVKAMAIEKAAEPARVVSLRFTGDVEVLKPLAGREGFANPNPATANIFHRPAQYRFSLFQSFLAAVGAVGMMALVLLSAVFIAIYDPPPGPDVASIDTADKPSDAAIVSEPEDGLTRNEEQLNTEILAVQNPPHAADEIRPVRSTAKLGPTRRVESAAYRPRRQSRRPKYVVTRFIPTTLVIYAENGEIKTRIEPQFAAVYKKSPIIIN